ncbi:V-type ATPase 116kDa subunit family protein [Herbivorax sp. ANBcel31]|uniref:V-type ATP synthase subunit I n=1 Tax=Herbivorax sp. ANBcel31 TaxID=3069754 RepID=UPI0027B07731|nr:V-type ATPase 116kDa subunit family protein [Herbivorax sp. ANBcel31]MDQ2087259.1 V-type ATPase 116kDa subunit family protein [Herbivorax sp. ANBcel31]
MSILKMKFINIVGPKDQFDDFVSNHIANSGIQLEYALGILEGIKGLSPYSDDNSHCVLVKRCSSLLESMGISENSLVDIHKTENIMPSDDIFNKLDWLENEFERLTSKKSDIKHQLEESFHVEKQLEMLSNIDVDLNRFFNFEFIKFRFGKMPKKSFNQLQLYLDELECILIPVSSDKEWVWIIYFTPDIYWEKVDGILSSLYFERTRISGDLKGTPSEALALLEEKISSLKEDLKDTEKRIDEFIAENRDTAIEVYNSFQNLNRICEIKKYVAQTKDSFYILGWIPKKELDKLIPVFEKYKDISFIVEEPDMVKHTRPPTELKNNSIFRPFETLVKMYGLPSYNEIDPTTFVAITYFLMFGIMFGDVGQGLVLFLFGFILMKKKIKLGGVITGASISSILFGFLYGSVFGFEDWIPHLWMEPMANINEFLIFGVVVGLILISSSMILNIINGIKSKNIVRVLFDKNGLAGFTFYWLAILFVLYFFNTGRVFVSIGFIALCLLLPITAIFFKDPIDNYIHKKRVFPEKKFGFFVETFFELFETVLSFASNTLSFIRLSAFALNHAGLFMAVLMLANMIEGVGSVIEIILGNLLIIALEGLIVGIQALRLEYYELFGRFFTGGGKVYHPLKNENIL